MTERRLIHLVPPGLLVALLITLIAALAPHAEAAEFGPFATQNPYTAPNGNATMHADSESSDSSPYPGPGTGAQTVSTISLGAVCTTILEGSDGMPTALCTSVVTRAPEVFLLDPATGAKLATLELPAGSVAFNGVYAYMDQNNRLVVFDANGNLIRVGHHFSGGEWKLSIDSSIQVGPTIDETCPNLCGGFIGLSPDWEGRVWFATGDGVAGFVDPRTGVTKTIALGSGEVVANSISTAPEGTAIATDHSLYLLRVDAAGNPKILWSYAYDRGPARKPGQLSHGTGSTPTFFGPDDGGRYLTILDNAEPREHLLVFDTWQSPGGASPAAFERHLKLRGDKKKGSKAKRLAAHRRSRRRRHNLAVRRRHLRQLRAQLRRLKHRHGVAPGTPTGTGITPVGSGGNGSTEATVPKLVCDLPTLGPGPSGSENSPNGSGRSVFVANTYGYPYAGATTEPSVPASAPFTGGIERVDLDPSGEGCSEVWQDNVRSAAVPRLDVPEDILYTVQDVDGSGTDEVGNSDTYKEAAIDADTGAVLSETTLGTGALFNTLQLAPAITPGRVLYQGTVYGIERVAATE